MTTLESLRNNLEGVYKISIPDLVSKISIDTGHTYESVRCNTFRYTGILPNWFYNEYTHQRNGRGRTSYVIRGNSERELKFNKDFVYDFLFDISSKSLKGISNDLVVTTFPGITGEDVKYLLDRGFSNINCIEKNVNHFNKYKELKYNTNDYNDSFDNVIRNLYTDILYYDSCALFSKCHQDDLEIINTLDLQYVYLTFKNIESKKMCRRIKNILSNYKYIDKMEYVSRTQKMIVYKYGKK